MIPVMICIKSVVISSFLALSVLPAPLAIEQSGAPPVAKRLVNAAIRLIIGNVRPTPVRGRLSISPDICPRYILSIMLYST